MVLGTSSYKNGIRATSFTRSDRGIGYLVGATDAPVVRCYYLDAAGDEAEQVVAYSLLDDTGDGVRHRLSGGHRGEAGTQVNTLIIGALLLGAGFIDACARWRFAACRRCSGSGKLCSPSGRAWRSCPRCGGSGKRVRIGRRIYEGLTGQDD